MKPTIFQVSVMKAETERLSDLLDRIRKLKEWRATLDSFLPLLTDDEKKLFLEKNKECYEYINRESMLVASMAVTPKDYWEANGDAAEVKNLLSEEHTSKLGA